MTTRKEGESWNGQSNELEWLGIYILLDREEREGGENVKKKRNERKGKIIPMMMHFGKVRPPRKKNRGHSLTQRLPV